MVKPHVEEADDDGWGVLGGADVGTGALLLDCDGTLAETERDGHRLAFNKAFQERGNGRRFGWVKGWERCGKRAEKGLETVAKGWILRRIVNQFRAVRRRTSRWSGTRSSMVSF